MTRRDVLACLHDVRRACELVERFTREATFERYAADEQLRSAVERQLEIVGEAIKRATEIDGGVGQRISGVGRIVAFRNRLIHGYATVSDEVVWGIVEQSVPTLHDEVNALITEIEQTR